jgi:pyruvate-formate lyase-activating enzyme
VTLDLARAMAGLGPGMSATVSVAPDERERVARWCEQTGHTLVSVSDGVALLRWGREPSSVEAPDRPPGARLWLYTNFDCNLSCDYCCVRSSPHAPRRELGLERVRRLVHEALEAGVGEIYLTGGEPFLLPDLAEIVDACVAALPTTILTNGTLFRGARLALLRCLPRAGLTLQISLDSADPALHDRHRGEGTWRRAVEGIRVARAEGFRVRVGATLMGEVHDEEEGLRRFLDELGIPSGDQVLRPVARRGLAQEGVSVTRQSLVPELTVTADGIAWHPVGADDEDLYVGGPELDLSQAISLITDSFGRLRRQFRARAEVFPCA